MLLCQYKSEIFSVKVPFTCVAISKLIKKCETTFNLHDSSRAGWLSLVQNCDEFIKNAL